MESKRERMDKSWRTPRQVGNMYHCTARAWIGTVLRRDEDTITMGKLRTSTILSLHIYTNNTGANMTSSSITISTTTRYERECSSSGSELPAPTIAVTLSRFPVAAGAEPPPNSPNHRPGPATGCRTGFRIRERVVWAGGMGGTEMVEGTAGEEAETRPGPLSRRMESRNKIDRGGSPMVVDKDVSDEDGEVNIDVEVEDEQDGGRGGEEGVVNVDGDVNIEMVENDKLSSNRGT